MDNRRISVANNPYRDSVLLMLMAMITFLCFAVALNLFLTGATGTLYDFWSGRRGSARYVATITSPFLRLLCALGGTVFLLISLYLGYRALNAWAR